MPLVALYSEALFNTASPPTLQKNQAVTILDSDQTTLAALYQDDAGTTTLGNPVTTTNNGTLVFRAPPGTYYPQISGVTGDPIIVGLAYTELSTARTPLPHATSHENGGSDALVLAESQITNLLTDLAAKAPLTSPALTGTPTAPTASNGTNTTQLATTAFVLANAGAGAVTSVAGRTGAVVIGESDVTNLTSDLSSTLKKANNLSDLTSQATAQINLGLGTAATQNKVPAGSVGVLDATSAIPESQITNLSADLAAKELGVIPTTTKTSAYTAAASDYVLCDTTTASFVVTLPTAPADRTRVGAKMIAQTSTNTVTLTCGGSDHFNIATGSTTYAIKLLNQGTILQYKASSAVWIIVSDDLPLGQLDLRYVGVDTTAVNVANHGIVGNGTDESAAWATLIASLPVNDKWDIYLPPTTAGYVLDAGQVVIPASTPGVTFRGDFGRTIIQLKAGSSNNLSTKALFNCNANGNILFRDLVFDGNQSAYSAAASGAYAITTGVPPSTAAIGTVAERCVFQNWGWGCFNGFTSSIKTTHKVTRCFFENCGVLATGAVTLVQVTLGQVENCVFDSCAGTHIAGKDIRNNYLKNGVNGSNTATNIAVISLRNNGNCTGCVLDLWSLSIPIYLTGILIGGAGSVAGCTIQTLGAAGMTGAAGISWVGSNPAAISGCEIDGCMDACIGGLNAAVTGNLAVTGCALYGGDGNAVTGNYAIYLPAGSANWAISGVSASGFTGPQEVVHLAGKGTFSGNSLYNNNLSASGHAQIAVVGGSGVALNSNNISAAGSSSDWLNIDAMSTGVSAIGNNLSGTGAATLTDNGTGTWVETNPGYNAHSVATWAPSTFYAKQDIVAFGQALWSCTVAHTSGAAFSYSTDWTLIASTGRRVFDVTNYGADPTGVNDSAPGIQAAINASLATGSGGQVYVPPGNYLLNSLNVGAALTGSNFACFGVDLAGYQTTNSASFVQPAANATVVVAMNNPVAWITVGVILIAGGVSNYTVTAISGSNITLKNNNNGTAYSPGTTVPINTVFQNNGAYVAPSLVCGDVHGGLYPASGGSEQTYGVQFTAGGSLVAGNWLMYWGGTPNGSIGGFQISSFLVNQNVVGGVLLLAGCGAYDVHHIFVRGGANSPTTPTPLAAVSSGLNTASGIVSAVNFNGGSNFCWVGHMSHIYTNSGGMDGICVNEGANSRTVLDKCETHTAGRYGLYAGQRSRVYRHFSQASTAAGYYMQGAWLIDCDSENNGTNEIICNSATSNGTGSPANYAMIQGGILRGTPTTGQTELNSALIYVQNAHGGLIISGVGMVAGAGTSEPLYIDSGIASGSTVLMTGCTMNPATWSNSSAVPTGVNLNGFGGFTNGTNSGFSPNTSMTTATYDAAGVAQQLLGTTATQTTTNKRVTKRVLALSANSATPTINTDNCDVVHITGQTAAITSFTTNLTGAPVDGDTLRISVTGTASIALTFGASFESSGTQTLPTTTTGTTRMDLGFIYNTETSKWRFVGAA